MKYTKVYMDLVTNKRMLLDQKTVKASLKASEEDMEITVGNYRITELEYPFVLVKPAN